MIPHRVFLSLGSNLGDRQDNLHQAIERLQKKGLKVVKTSRFYETQPWGYLKQPTFVNAVIETFTVLSPVDLLRSIKQIEVQMGRAETFKWGPRLIDIDILFYDDLIMVSPELTIPHSLVHKRGFVLLPMSEIAPKFVHPIFKKDIETLLEELNDKDLKPQDHLTN